MRGPVELFLACAMLAGTPTFGQGRPTGVSLIELIANPAVYNGELVTVYGYLVMGGPRDLVASVLYLNKEDADNMLPNGILVVQNAVLQHQEEKIDRMYVVLTGTFRANRGRDGHYTDEIDNVQWCARWSDPLHPGRPHD